MDRTWKVAPRTHDDIIAQLLANRGVDEKDSLAFLEPSWERDVYPWSAFTRMPEAVASVFAALEAGERVVIHGDYDADGVSGSSLLFLALQEIVERLTNAGVEPFIARPEAIGVFLPDRERDGYGVAMHTVERLAGEGTKLLVTVDCGIANGLELDRGYALGMRAVVCDHHQLGEHLPAHAVLLHPLAPGETYPNRVLCGTGVAFKFASALIDEARRRGAAFPEGYEKWFLDFVAIATVTDVMPLVGENRALETFGLRVLNKTRRPGLRAILEASGTELGAIDTQAIGWRIGPRLNAAGRLASAEIAFTALTAPTAEAASVASARLEALNRERQAVFMTSYAVARSAAAEQQGSVLVVCDDAWLPGIVGLIAGRLVNDFGKPSFAFTKVGEHYVGSGRTAAGLHLVEAMNACGDMFIKKGGHPQACGLTIRTRGNVDQFRDEISAFANTIFLQRGAAVELAIDADVLLGELTLAFVDRLALLEPYGEGNRQPVFAVRPVTVLAATPVGSTRAHLRLTVIDEQGMSAKVIAFGFGARGAEFSIGERIEMAIEVGVNIWNGRREPQLRLVDARPISC